MINDKADEVMEKRFQSFLSRYQIGFKTLVKGCDFTLNVFLYCITNVIK